MTKQEAAMVIAKNEREQGEEWAFKFQRLQQAKSLQMPRGVFKLNRRNAERQARKQAGIEIEVNGDF